jgi:hypothetical protein
MAKPLNADIKKPDSVRFFKHAASGDGEFGWIAHGCLSHLTALHLSKGLANDLLGDAGAFTALGADTEGFPHVAVATAAFKNGISNLTVGDTLAKTYIHGVEASKQFRNARDHNDNENACQRGCD